MKGINGKFEIAFRNNIHPRLFSVWDTVGQWDCGTWDRHMGWPLSPSPATIKIAPSSAGDKLLMPFATATERETVKSGAAGGSPRIGSIPTLEHILT